MRKVAASLTAIVSMSVGFAGCAASTDAGDEHSSETSQEVVYTPQYIVSIDNFWVTYPRAKTDTVTAGISMGWADNSTNPPSLLYTPELHQYRHVGNVSNGGVNISDFSVTMAIPNDKMVRIAVGLENTGNNNNLGTVSDFVAWGETTHNLYGIGPIWPANSSFSEGWYDLPRPDTCDGLVAADGAVQSGAELYALTANGPYTRTVMFPGTDSNWGCGRNSLYYMTWTIKRAPRTF